MSTQDLVLNIAVNLGRLAKWSMEGQESRIKQFILDTERYLQELESAKISSQFEATFKAFKKNFQDLKRSPTHDEVWAEKALTWADILQHRAKLA